MKISLGKINGPKTIKFKAEEDFNPLRTIDVEWNCCMAVGFNPQIQKNPLAGGDDNFLASLGL
ncbi:hypothetical protein PPO43_14145 [Saprospira sp. CCB-QB6]|uniref:hypothetical protein n=1 Tax=Saprospira sp. CCB-QB6 TaxID=3023936 RepID=UPI00234B7AB8|nr:hypothetical protein [Saprospira sp. CCB-QB6]WCL81112.1 hypothetical protein PPO43_14145 [Saprospira sp. CCB-QB6]